MTADDFDRLVKLTTAFIIAQALHHMSDRFEMFTCDVKLVGVLNHVFVYFSDQLSQQHAMLLLGCKLFLVWGTWERRK